MAQAKRLFIVRNGRTGEVVAGEERPIDNKIHAKAIRDAYNERNPSGFYVVGMGPDHD
jgi:hypothetical protein